MQRELPNGQKFPFGCSGYIRNGRGRWPTPTANGFILVSERLLGTVLSQI